MRILYLSSFYASNPPRWLADAFQDLGHDIFRVGPTYPEHGNVDWGKWNVQPDLELPRQSTWNIPAYVDECTRRIGAPDFVIASEESYHNEIIPVGGKIPTVLLSWDGWPEAFERHKDFQSVLNYTGHPYGVRAKPRVSPHPEWKYFAPACYPKVHRLLGFERDIDFSLRAAMYGGRPKICNFLRDRGLHVSEGYASVDEYVEAYNRTLFTYINANAQEEIKWRWAENIACGAITICDHTELYSWIGAQPYVHYYPVERIFQPDLNEEWPTGEMIYECIMKLKSEPTLANFIRSNALNLVLNNHTYYHRADQILEALMSL